MNYAWITRAFTRAFPYVHLLVPGYGMSEQEYPLLSAAPKKTERQGLKQKAKGSSLRLQELNEFYESIKYLVKSENIETSYLLEAPG